LRARIVGARVTVAGLNRVDYYYYYYFVILQVLYRHSGVTYAVVVGFSRGPVTVMEIIITGRAPPYSEPKCNYCTLPEASRELAQPEPPMLGPTPIGFPVANRGHI